MTPFATNSSESIFSFFFLTSTIKFLSCRFLLRSWFYSLEVQSRIHLVRSILSFFFFLYVYVEKKEDRPPLGLFFLSEIYEEALQL